MGNDAGQYDPRAGSAGGAAGAGGWRGPATEQLKTATSQTPHDACAGQASDSMAGLEQELARLHQRLTLVRRPPPPATAVGKPESTGVAVLDVLVMLDHRIRMARDLVDALCNELVI